MKSTVYGLGAPIIRGSEAIASKLANGAYAVNDIVERGIVKLAPSSIRRSMSRALTDATAANLKRVGVHPSDIQQFVNMNTNFANIARASKSMSKYR